MEGLLSQADRLYEQRALPQLHDTMSRALQADGSDDPRVLWRYARACFFQAEEKEDKKWRRSHFEQGLKEAERCIEIEPGNGLCHKWLGILLARMGDFISTKEKIGNAYAIRGHFEKAVKFDPKDAIAPHCLGEWSVSVARLSWLERQAATVLFATPPESSYEEAEAHYLRAAELDPLYQDNTFALGQLYEAMKRKQDAQKWYSVCAGLTALSEKEKRIQAEAAKRAKQLL
eukprot:EG_transcript_26477